MVSARVKTRFRKGLAAELHACGARLRLATAMQREGTALMRENLRRRHPRATEIELDTLLERWLLERSPDAPGRRVPWPRSKHHAE